MFSKRLATLAVIIVVVILVATGSWIMGSNIQSPAEAAARTAPPQAAPILVAVEERVLTANVVTRGTARFGLPQAIAVAPSSLKAAAGVITSLPERGAQFDEGDVLLAASGRPLFVLAGQTPAYRDLIPGLVGEDVRQLEEALLRLNFDPGPVDGVYDILTSSAVAAWYTAAGWEPFGATAEQLAAIEALDYELARATNAQMAAEDEAATAPLAVEAARAKADHANKAAQADIVNKQTDQQRVTADPNASAEDQAAATAALALAQATAKAVRLQGEVLVQQARNAQKIADREATIAAQYAGDIAAKLAQAQAHSGMQIPLDEVVFMPNLPVRIEQNEVEVGDAARGPLLLVTNDQLAIDSSLPLSEAPLVKPGMVVFIDEPDLGVRASGVVAQVAETPGTDGVDGYHVYFETLVTETATDLDGFSLRLTIPAESTGGAVLTVPISALSLAGDGASRVQVQHGDALEYVAVEPGFAAGGFVAVTPISGTITAGDLVVIGFEQP